MDSPPPKFTSRDVDTLISAVKDRPPLYSRTERYGPQHKHKKTTLWREVCRELNSDFDNLSRTDKLEYEREVHRRWRSLRTCFSRELTLQRREKLRAKVKRRKRYEYFEALSFLMPEYENDFQEDTMHILHFGNDDETAEVAELEEPRSEEETFQEIKFETEIENYSETEIFVDSDPVQIEPKRERYTLDSTRTEKRELDTLEDLTRTEKRERVTLEDLTRTEKRQRDTLEDLTRTEKKEESDSDKLFILSLVPSFRRINPKKKLAAKIELMKVLQSFQDD